MLIGRDWEQLVREDPRPETERSLPSGEVRVRYFDPITGEPRESRPVPRSEQLRAAGRPAPPRKRAGWKWHPKGVPGNAVACTVDGVRYASISEAARATGIGSSALHAAHVAGRGSVRGHAVSFGAAR